MPVDIFNFDLQVVLNPEDAKVLKVEEIATEEHPNVARVKRLTRNF
jgi:hypothetical protein